MTFSTMACVNGCLSRDRHADDCGCSALCPEHDDHCDGCMPRRATFGAWCGGCERRAGRALATIRACWPAMFGGRSSSVAGKGSTPALYTRDDDALESDDVPATDRVVDVREELLEVLRRLVRWVVAERDLFLRPPGDDALQLVTFLARHLEWMAQQRGAAAAVYSELRTTAHLVRRTAQPGRRDWVSLGPCPLRVPTEVVQPDEAIEVEDWPCPGRIRAYTDPAHPESQIGVCDSCGTEAVPEWWERRMYPDRETTRLVTADDLVTLVYRALGKPVKPATVRLWVHRGVIAPTACSLATRSSLFDSFDVVRALSDRGLA